MTARTLRTGEAAARGGDLPRHALLLLAALLAAFLTVAPRAEAFVYWTSSASIGRANLDGTWLDGFFINQGAGPCGVAVDGAHVYWVNQIQVPASIGRANLDGSGAVGNFIPIPAACGVAVDGAHIYWANGGLGGGLGRANLDGTGIDQDFIPDPDNASACGVAVDGSHVYWARSPGGIGRANLNGTGIDEDFIANPDGWPCGVAVDGTHIYWANRVFVFEGGSVGQLSIGRANLNGTGADEEFIPLDGAPFAPCGVAVDGQHLYWASWGAVSPPGPIGRANLDGTGVDRNFIPLQVASNCGVAVDALSGDFSFGKVKKNKSTGTAKLTVELPGPGKLDLAKTNKVKGDHLSAEHGGTVHVLLKANEKTRKRLKAKGKVTVEATVTFWLRHAEPYIASKKINLVKRQGEQEKSLQNNGATG